MRRFGPLHRVTTLLPLACALFALVSCGRSSTREFELIGQVLAVDTARRTITIKHGDIQGFMPAMTMPFNVRDERLLAGRVPGDVVKATLVVERDEAYLKTVQRIGSQEVSQGATPPAPHILNTGEAVADAALTDESGQPFSLAAWRGNVIAVTFIYTRCPLPNFCPLMDRHFASVQRQLRDDSALRGRVRLLSVTLDPAHDTPAVLARHAAGLGADPAVWRFATGPAAAVTAFGGQFGVSAFRDEPEAAEIVHNLRTAVIDREGRLADILNGSEWTPDQLVAAMRAAY